MEGKLSDKIFDFFIKLLGKSVTNFCSLLRCLSVLLLIILIFHKQLLYTIIIAITVPVIYLVTSLDQIKRIDGKLLDYLNTSISKWLGLDKDRSEWNSTVFVKWITDMKIYPVLECLRHGTKEHKYEFYRRDVGKWRCCGRNKCRFSLSENMPKSLMDILPQHAKSPIDCTFVFVGQQPYSSCYKGTIIAWNIDELTISVEKENHWLQDGIKGTVLFDCFVANKKTKILINVSVIKSILFLLP